MNQTVFVVDDESMRDALTQLLEAVGLQVKCHANGSTYLATHSEDRPGCLILDMAIIPRASTARFRCWYAIMAMPFPCNAPLHGRVPNPECPTASCWCSET